MSSENNVVGTRGIGAGIEIDVSDPLKELDYWVRLRKARPIVEEMKTMPSMAEFFDDSPKSDVTGSRLIQHTAPQQLNVPSGVRK